MINNTAGYILLLALTIVLYDVVTHLDEEIDYIVRSRFTSVKTIFILCRYLPFIIGALRMYDVVGEDYIDANVLNRNPIFSFADRCLVVLGVMSRKHLDLFSPDGLCRIYFHFANLCSVGLQ